MVTWELVLKIVGGISLLAGAVALLVATYRAKSEDTWRKTAERRKEDLADLTANVAKLKEELKAAEHDRDDFTQRYLRAQSKVDWYEPRYGPIPPDSHTASRG